MSYREDRERAIAKLTTEGLPFRVIEGLLRAASTLQRLAVAQCNGDWPADNGERKTEVCSGCEGGWAPSVLKRCPALDPPATTRPEGGRYPRYCPDCRTAQRVRELLPAGYVAHFAGDPRGYVLHVQVPSGATEYAGADGIAVPGRER